MSIKLDLTPAGHPDLSGYQALVTQIHQKIQSKTGIGSDFLGWSTWPFDYDKNEFEKVKSLAKTIRENAEVLVVCGIGGSYLGSRAAIEMIQGLYPKRDLELVYLGNTLSSSYIVQALDHIKDKSVYVNVISKSGTTTETAMAFRLLKQFLEQKYGKDEAKKRIIATTDKQKGDTKVLCG